MKRLGGQIVAPERYPEQELVAGADTALDQVALDDLDVIERRSARRTLEPGCKPPSGADMEPLRRRAEIARRHAVDHAIPQ